MTRAILRAFGRFQRPASWAMLVGGVVMFVVVALDIVATGQAKLASLLGAVIVFNDGFQSVQSVENEIDSEAAA